MGLSSFIAKRGKEAGDTRSRGTYLTQRRRTLLLTALFAIEAKNSQKILTPWIFS